MHRTAWRASVRQHAGEMAPSPLVELRAEPRPQPHRVAYSSKVVLLYDNIYDKTLAIGWSLRLAERICLTLKLL